MKLLRLPSGQGINVDLITGWDAIEKGVLAVYFSKADSAGVDYYHETDARALYAWLVANSTAIGEDGREVDTQSKALKSAPLIGQFKPGMLVRTTRNIIGSDVGSRLEPDKVIISQDTQGEIQRVDKYDIEGLPLMVEFEDRGRHWTPLDALEIVKQSDEGN